MRSNPLASHGGLTIKADAGHSTSRRLILEASSEVGMICLDGDKGHFNLMHLGASLDVETCPMAEELLQGVMNRGHIEVYSAKRGERDVCMQSYDKNPSKPKPLVIHFTRDVTTQRPRGFQPVIVKKPAPFPLSLDRTGSSGVAKIRPLRVMPLILDIFLTLADGRLSLTCMRNASFLPSGPCAVYFHGTVLSLL